MRTTKPCPGCKQVAPYRAADDVCNDCRDRLKFFVALEVEQKGAVKRKEVVAVRVPGADHWLPHMPNARVPDQEFCGEGDLGGKFQAAFRELALGLSDPTDNCSADPIGIATYTIHESPGGGSNGDRLMQPGVARCLREIYDTTRAISENAFALGHRAGLRLLNKIRTGQISVNDAELEAAKVAQAALQPKRRSKR